MMRRAARRAAAAGFHALADARNRGFSPMLRHDPSAPALVLSPHLDDAVIDCWSVLTADREIAVVTVFAGVPGQAGVLVHWDRLAGATDSAALMRARREEDRRALALAGREPRHLDLLPDPYRTPRRTPLLADLDRAVTAAVPAASAVLAPAVLGVVHPDHLLVRSYALAVAGAGVPVELYADQPYAVQYGWPHWVTGGEPDPHLDVDAVWQATPGRVAPVGEAASARVVALDAPARAAKLEAMRAYETQFPMLDRGPIGQLSTPLVHGYEVLWPIGR
jgi:LmbE family N-acetylglucosaminyl deacetylase